jgi:hypothetical protein
MRLLIAAAVLATTLPIATSSAFAQGYGQCTPPGNSAVGAAGPAMNGGQLMAGVGQCGRIAGSPNPRAHWRSGGYYRPRYSGSYARY